VPCTSQVHFFAEETITKSGDLSFTPCQQNYPSQPITELSPGFGQSIQDSRQKIKGLHTLSEDTLGLQTPTNRPMRFPLIIEVVATPLNSAHKHSIATYTIFEKTQDDTLGLRVVAQKINADGRVFLLREIYGIERKPAKEGEEKLDDEDESERECVVCMSEPMDTMVLPCRHLCLCNSCAEVLRYQASKCPICRAPFHSLLKISVAKKTEDLTAAQQERTAEQENTAPPGYRVLPVVEALRPPASTTIDHGYLEVEEEPVASSETVAAVAAANAARSPIATAGPVTNVPRSLQQFPSMFSQDDDE